MLLIENDVIYIAYYIYIYYLKLNIMYIKISYTMYYIYDLSTKCVI